MSHIPNERLNSRKAVKNTLKSMIPPVLTAVIAAALGFMALYSSPVPMIRDFGNMLTLGIIVSFMLGLFLLLPLLYIRDGYFFKPGNKDYKLKREGKMDRFLGRWTRTIMVLKWPLLIGAIALAVAGVIVDIDAPAETDIETFMPQESKALVDIQTIREKIGSTEQLSIIFEPVDEEIFDDQIIDWLAFIEADIENEFQDEVVQVQSMYSVYDKQDDNGNDQAIDSFIEEIPSEQRSRLINVEKTAGAIHLGIMKMGTDELDVFVGELEEYLNESRPGSVDLTVTGQAIIDLEMVQGLTTGRYQMTLLGLAFVFAGLLAIYRRPVKAILPLFPIVLIAGWSGLVVYMTGISYTPLTATLGALIIGIGTEFTILLTGRYEEERKKGTANVDAIIKANQKIGTAIIASALTTMAGFSALLFSDFAILSSFGMMTLVNIALAVFSTLVIMPALLLIIGPRLKYPQTN